MTLEERAKGAFAAMQTPHYGVMMPLNPNGSDPYWEDVQCIVRAIRAAVAEEREACAQLAEACVGAGAHTKPQRIIAAAIRARQ